MDVWDSRIRESICFYDSCLSSKDHSICNKVPNWVVCSDQTSKYPLWCYCVFAKASSSDKYCQFVYPISQPLSTHDLASFCSYANWTSKSRALKLRNHCWKIAGLNMSQNHGVSSKFRKKVCRLLRNRYSMVTYAIQNILNKDNTISDMVEVFRNTVSQKALELLGLRWKMDLNGWPVAAFLIDFRPL